jgi:hypothetical protein
MHASKGPAYGMFATTEDPEKRYYDFEEIRAKIESETNRICGPRGLTTVTYPVYIYMLCMMQK